MNSQSERLARRAGNSRAAAANVEVGTATYHSRGPVSRIKRQVIAVAVLTICESSINALIFTGQEDVASDAPGASLSAGVSIMESPSPATPRRTASQLAGFESALRAPPTCRADERRSALSTG